jgi:hypothetical protein
MTEISSFADIVKSTKQITAQVGEIQFTLFGVIIPADVVALFILFMPIGDILSFRESCKLFHQSTNSNSLWKLLYLRDFPFYSDEKSDLGEVDYRNLYENLHKSNQYYLAYFQEQQRNIQFGSLQYLKVSIAGAEKTGKSCLLERIKSNSFLHTYFPNIGPNTYTTHLVLRNHVTQTQFWDLTDIRGITNASRCVLFLYNLHERSTFETLEIIFNYLMGTTSVIPVILVIGNYHKGSNRTVSKSEALQWVESKNFNLNGSKQNVFYTEVCLQNGYNVYYSLMSFLNYFMESIIEQ